MAAGLGFKDFTTGEVLTAADVDGYLMQGVWVFASATARDAAVTSPQEGNFAYLKDTNVTTYYTGSAWANLDTTGMTNPMTTTGDTIYSSSGSTPARLGIGTAGQVLQVNSGATAPEWATPASGLTFVGASVYNVAVQSIANGTFTALNFDSENYDTDGFHSTSSNTSRFTIPTGKGGKYLINATFETDANATGQRTLAFYKNGSVEIYCGNVVANARQPKSIGNVVLNLAANDYVEAFYYQDSGTSQNITLGQLYARFTINYLGA
jgi:hypothetical protein